METCIIKYDSSKCSGQFALLNDYFLQERICEKMLLCVY